MKYSKQRQKILEIINNSCNHPTAYMIYEEVKKEIADISLGTVYRNLNSLVENNIIKKISLETDRFDKNTDHCHLCCIKCNKIIDIGLLNIDKMIMDNYNFKVLNNDVVLKGICYECMERKN